MTEGFIKKINTIYEKIDSIDTANKSFNKEIVNVLLELKDLDFELITKDLRKRTFLGNRKIDINLALNMQGIDMELMENNPKKSEDIWTDSSKTVMYDKAIALFKDGTEIEIPFTFDKNPTSISTHSDLLLQLDNNINFKEKLESTTISAFPSLVVGEFLRFYDVPGQSSNLDKITLNAISGAYKEQNPMYYWAKTTSAVETLSMRGGDIIKLGNEIDNILTLVNKISEIVDIQEKLPELIGSDNDDISIYNKLSELEMIYNNLKWIISVYNNISNINNVSLNKTNIDKVASQELALKEIINNLKAIQDASFNADIAKESKELALEYVNQMTGLTVKVIQLTSDQLPTQAYNSATNTLILGIPKGLKGDRGEPFKVSAYGTFSERKAYDGAATGFSYLAIDINPTMIYFKKSDAVSDWTDGIAFGKGDKGDRGYSISDITKISTDGNIDTYKIIIEDGSTYDFKVINSDVSSVNGKTGKVILSKADIGLNNVDNTKDLNKPISIAVDSALSLKVNVADIIDNLLSTLNNVPLSANQGRVLKEQINELQSTVSSINTILQSNDTTLDDLQEIVNYIKLNKTTLNTLNLSNIAETTTLKYFTNTLKLKLESLPNSVELNNQIINSVPAGVLIDYAGGSVPAGFLKANGSLLSRVTYSKLFNAIGTKYGSTNTGNFRLPDTRGLVTRGLDEGRGLDNGRVLGSYQSDAFKSHSHTGSTSSAGNHSHYVKSYWQGSSDGSVHNYAEEVQYNTKNIREPTNVAGAHTHAITINPSGSNETRMKNLAVLKLIKY